MPVRNPPAPLAVGAVQMEAEPADVTGNARRAAALTTLAAAEGARVVVFPELSLCAYDLRALQHDPERCAVRADPSGAVDDPRLAPLARATAEYAVLALVGAAVRHPDGALTNSLLAVDAAGVTVAYSKQHLWPDGEADLFHPGDRGATLTVDGWRLGLGICYDLSFPEHARVAAIGGAHAYVCPSAFAAGREHRAAIYLAGRALDNTLYTVFVNPVGGPRDRPCDGGTAVYGPEGGLTGRAAGNQEQTLLTELDPAEVVRVRSHLHMLAEAADRYWPPLRRGAGPQAPEGALSQATARSVAVSDDGVPSAG